MAVSSYLPDVAGGMVSGAAFADDGAAGRAITLLHDAGVRSQDLSVVTRDPERAARIAGDQAWYPGKGAGGILRLFNRLTGGLPKDVRRRYGLDLAAGRVVVIAAAGGQPADTLAALFEQAGGASVGQWWQLPAGLFAPPELAGPF